MGVQLLSITDPRDNLEKARRTELWDYAREKGVSEIRPDMPAILMRKILRAKGLVQIKIPDRILGTHEVRGENPMTAEPGGEISYEDDLARQYARTDIDQMTIQELRNECKRLGIKMARTDNLHSLRGKLREQNAA